MADRNDNRTNGNGKTERLLSPPELADYLKVPLTTLYSWRHSGDGPPGFRVGKHVRYRWTDVQDWVQDQFNSAAERRP